MSLGSGHVLCPDEGPHALAGHYLVQVAPVGHVEHDDRQVVVHAQSERGRVHHLQAAGQRVLVGDLGDELGVGSIAGSAV